MKFLDLFAGIGGFRLGMEMAGHECVGYVEIDKFARKSYEAIHDTEGEWTAHDITSVTDEQWQEFRGKVDIICGGFPCQAFSVAGKRGGFSDTRGTLFFEIARAAEQIKPRILLLENVKGLLSHDKGKTFATILTTLDELGYDAEWQVLNSKDFGVPQNRERVFIIGHLRGGRTRKVFPIGRTNGATDLPIKQVAQYDTEKRKNTNRFRTYDPNGIAACLSTMGGGGLEPHITVIEDFYKNRKPREFQDVVPTLTAQDKHGVAIQEPLNTTTNGDSFAITTRTHACYGEDAVRKNRATSIKQTEPNLRIRKLTPKECWRLQGFPDWAFEKAQEVNSDSQLYKQAGNSVTVNVIYEIAKRL